MNKKIVIVSPALADANNGNWQTAQRWCRLLRPHHAVRIVRQWPDGPDAQHDDAMLALHARRSADSITAWGRAHASAHPAEPKPKPTPGLAVVLTGTDLYQDIQTDAHAQQSLQWAQRLVVLQERGPAALPPAMRSRAVVVLQSTGAWQTLAKPRAPLRVVMVGHLRDEKSPQTLFAAARLIAPDEGIVIDHIGAPLDAALGEQARATAQACSHYRWLGELPHAQVRRRIQRAHVLVHASRIEGGAHVVMEAVRSGTVVLASHIDGNVGMLGDNYAGYFEWNNAAELVQLLQRCRDAVGNPAGPDGLYAQLQRQCAQRAPLFSAEAEKAALLQLVQALTSQPN
jgi:putative glycosyltransferase (TIGR04348 family)